MGRATERRRVVRLRNGLSSVRPDALAVEEPLEIRVGGRPLTVTMRTPGYDLDLVAGLLVTEGVVRSSDQLTALRYRAGSGEDGARSRNAVDASVRAGTGPAHPRLDLLTPGSRGLCGPDAVEAVRTHSVWDIASDPLVLDPEVLYSLPKRLMGARGAFGTTGWLPVAGLFTAAGELLCAREDVAEHNAADKVVGWALREGLLPLTGRVLMISGRASFKVGQKVAMAGIPALAAAAAPSNLAVDLAAELGITLIGLLRDHSASLYAGAHRVTGVPAF